jgi:UPF0716 family protein affecting phage T7 exclusion
MTRDTLTSATTSTGPVTARTWRVVGALGIVHVVLILAALSLQAHALFEDGRGGLDDYANGSLTRTVVGGYADLIGFLALVPVFVVLARGIGRRTELGRVAAMSGLVAGSGYVFLTFSPGLAAGVVSMHGVQQHAAVDAAWLMNNLRVITFVMSLVLLGAHAIALAVAARADARSGSEAPAPRLLGVGGFVVGAALVACPALLAAGLQDLPVLLWMVWWVAVSVQMVRRNDR